MAISASQSGPAHSFIVGEALKSAAARAGHKLGLKVISHLGEQGSFSDDDLAKADVAVVVADGPVDLSDLPKTLRIFETTPQAVFDDADGVVAQAVAGSGEAAKAAPTTSAVAPGGKPPTGMKVVAITSCPTGVAHTFMAAEAYRLYISVFFFVYYSCIMSCRHIICTYFHGIIQKRPEFYFFITHHIGIWCSTSFIFIQKVYL